jgi:integrase/recombinase XerD
MTKKLPLAKIDPKLKAAFESAQTHEFGDFVREFILQFVSLQTQKAYAKDLKFFFEFLAKGGLNLNHPEQIQAHHFRLYRDSLIENDYSSATINRRLVCIRSFIKWCIGAGLMKHNPLDQIKLPKTQTQNPTLAFSDEEVNRMLEAPENNRRGRMHRLAMLFLFNLGLRRSELTQIQIKDFYQDRGHHVLSIKGKGAKLRDMPLPASLINEIEQYSNSLKIEGIDLDPTDYLFFSGKKPNKPIDGSTVFRIINRYAKKLGINKRVSPHSCRATAISHLLDTQNTPMRDVAIFAGHSKITTTERYDKRRKGLDDNAAYKVNYKKSS